METTTVGLPLDIYELANAVGVHKGTIYKWLKRANDPLPCHRPWATGRGKPFFVAEEVSEWMRRQSF